MRAMSRSPERIRREEDESGAAPARGSELAARILRMQATAGNHAVSQLLRVSASAAKRLKKAPGGVTLATMQAFQKAGELSDPDVDSMLLLDDEELAEAIKLEARLFKGCSAESDMSARLRYARSASKAPKTTTVRPTSPRDIVVADVQGAGVLLADARAFVHKVGVGEAKAWIVGKSNKVVAAAVRLCIATKGAATLDEIDALVSLDAGMQNYGADVVVPLAAERGLAAVEVALQQTRADHSVNYLQAWLELNAEATSSQTFKDLIRLKGRLLDGITGMAVYQADTRYEGAKDFPHSRTGFLRYNFGGSYVELHTHWNENVHKIVSIHVKEGDDKSTELNAWPSHFFGEVNAAVLAAHNAATGALAPTGGALTL